MTPSDGGAASSSATEADVRTAVQSLVAPDARIGAADWSGHAVGSDQPGLYAWWTDPDGAGDLAAGLQTAVAAGMIYGGQAGATRWPSGHTGKATLRTRIAGNHLDTLRSLARAVS